MLILNILKQFPVLCYFSIFCSLKKSECIYHLPTWNLHPTMLCIKDSVVSDLLPETSSHPRVYCLPGHVEASITSMFSFPGDQHRWLDEPPVPSQSDTLFLWAQCLPSGGVKWHLHDTRLWNTSSLVLKFYLTLIFSSSTIPRQLAWVNLVAKKIYLSQLSQVWSQCGANVCRELCVDSIRSGSQLCQKAFEHGQVL